MLNHQSASPHPPNTSNPRRDHVEDRIWIGSPVALDEELLPEHDDAPEAAGEPNTRPTLEP